MTEHWFWMITLAAVLVWYSTITFYVAIRGVRDIRAMLKNLGERDPKDSGVRD